MLHHHESSPSLGRFDPDWISAHERVSLQQRLRSNCEVDRRPWWRGAFFAKPRAEEVEFRHERHSRA
jgi:hypothetical protein